MIRREITAALAGLMLLAASFGAAPGVDMLCEYPSMKQFSVRPELLVFRSPESSANRMENPVGFSGNVISNDV